MARSTATTPDQSLVRVQVAADRYGVCGRTIRNYVARKQLTAYKMGPRLLFVDLDEVATLLRPINVPAGDGGKVA